MRVTGSDQASFSTLTPNRRRHAVTLVGLVPALHRPNDGVHRLGGDASAAGDMDLPGFRLHRLKGDLAGFWSVTVSSNWRVIFRFEGGHASDVDLVDYH